MRFLFLYTGRIPPTKLRHEFKFARKLAERDHQVELIATSSQNRWFPETETGENLRILGTPKGVLGPIDQNVYNPLDFGWRAFEACRKEFDVVVGWHPRHNVAIPYYLARLLDNVGVFVYYWEDLWSEDGGVWDCYQGPLGRFTAKTERHWEELFLERADAVAMHSPGLHRRAREIGLGEARVVKLPPPFNCDDIEPVPKGAAREEVGIPPEEPVLLSMSSGAGRVDRDLLTMMRSIVEEVPEARLMFVGPKDPGRTELASKLRIQSNVFQTGWVSDEELSTYLSCADVMAMPYLSDWENEEYRWPYRIGDFMAAGRPVVAHDIGAVSAVIEDGHNGRLVPHTKQAFVDASVELLKNPDRASKLGKNARLTAESYSWGEHLHAFEEGVQRIAEEKGVLEGKTKIGT